MALQFYNFDKILSFNATFNFIIGGRGLGKTYGAKSRVISAAIKRGDEFVFVRRYKDELKRSRDTFFADLEAEGEFPDWHFRVNGDKAEMAPAATHGEKKREWKVIGYFVPLSIAQSIKGVSYPNVKWIIFDEFIIEKGHTHYLPNEAIAFQQLYSTVDRWKDKTRVLFLANSVSITNPYFLHYAIKPTPDDEFIRMKPTLKTPGGFIACHFPDSAEFKEGVYKTAFGQFIQESDNDYAEYAVGNQFADNHNNLLAFKPSDASYTYSLETKAGVFSVWIDWKGPFYYIQSKRPKREEMYTILPEKMTEDKTLLVYSDKMVQMLRASFKGGRCFFDEAKTREAFIEIFRR